MVLYTEQTYQFNLHISTTISFTAQGPNLQQYHNSDPALLVCQWITLLPVGKFICPEVWLEDRPTKWRDPFNWLTSNTSNDIGTRYQPVLHTSNTLSMLLKLSQLATIIADILHCYITSP